MDLKHRSRNITDGRDHAPSRAMFKAIGFSDEDLRKPIIGVANTWIETMPCNFHLRRLSAKVKDGIRAAGGTPMEFNTIAICDGETMGTEGMRASLVSREVIADSIELVCRGQLFDAVVCVVGCDKTIPAAAMALARMNLPGMVLYGGTIAPGEYRGKDVTIQDVFEAVGANAAGKMSRRRTARTRKRCLPEFRCVRRTIHGEHDVNRDGVDWAFADGFQQRACYGRAQGRDCIPVRRGRHESPEERDSAQATFSPAPLLKTRLPAWHVPGDRRMRFSSAGDRPGSGRSLAIDDFQKVSERTPLLADLKPAGKLRRGGRG